MTKISIQYAELLRGVNDFMNGSQPDVDVSVASRALVDAELLCQPRFGLSLLHELADGRVDSARMVSDTGALAVMDATGCFGPTVLSSAVAHVVNAAETLGAAVVAVRGLGSFGRMLPYVEAIADRGFVGWAGASSAPAVAPHGGKLPLVGTNPIAIAVPSRTAVPFSFDAATSAMTMAEVHDAKKFGTPLRHDTAIGAEGVSVTNADDLVSVLPRGGLLGTLTALMVEALTSAVTGQAPVVGSRSTTLIAIRADADAGDRLRAELLASGGREPGSASRQILAARQKDGVDVDVEIARLLGLSALNWTQEV